MPNKDLMKLNIPVIDKHRGVLGDRLSGNNLTTKKSRLENKENKSPEEESALKWLTKRYEKEIKLIKSGKKTRMNDGEENVFKKTHTKDKSNKNVDKVGGVAKLSNSSEDLNNNRVQYYESVDKHIEQIKYLIEYLNK